MIKSKGGAKRSEQVRKAIEWWVKISKKRDPSILACANIVGIHESTLYRALIKDGLIKRRKK